MRAVVQRVANACVKVNSGEVASVGPGIVALVGICIDDTVKDMEYIAGKLPDLRIFEDGNSVMNLSLRDIDGELLVISQFTLYGDARKGRRPSYSDAMPPDKAIHYYDDFLKMCMSKYSKVQSGKFGAFMDVELINSGPITILLDSRRNF